MATLTCFTNNNTFNTVYKHLVKACVCVKWWEKKKKCFCVCGLSDSFSRGTQRVPEGASGWMGIWTDGRRATWGGSNVSRSRPSADDKCSSLQLSQVDPHLCAVTRFPHPKLQNTRQGWIILREPASPSCRKTFSPKQLSWETVWTLCHGGEGGVTPWTVPQLGLGLVNLVQWF